MRTRSSTALLTHLLIVATTPGWALAEENPAITRNLEAAGANRTQLEAALASGRESGDAEMATAMEFLIANMDGHGYIVTRLFDAGGAEVPFDAENHGDFAAAQARMDELEREHGTLEFRRERFVSDLETVTADFLVNHVTTALETWRTAPWCRGVSLALFCEHILPYRGSNEPLEAWRAPCRARLAGVLESLGSESDVRVVGARARDAAASWVGFNELYYLHPTDQSFTEMTQSGRGRCEDITNMMAYAARSAGAMLASDYTPWWPDRDNNHAWEVILDAEGRGTAPLSNRAAKVYRKSFAHQPASLGASKPDGEVIPRWLEGTHFRDVTAEYVPVSDLPVEATRPRRSATALAYLCVFNGGEWRPIHWARLENSAATFTAMGRNIAYLPVTNDAQGIDALAEPFILTTEGERRVLDGRSLRTTTLELSAAPAVAAEANAQTARPTLQLEMGRGYELFVWQDGAWRTVGHITAAETSTVFENLAIDRLYWLVADDSRKLERIFTIEDGRVVSW